MPLSGHPPVSDKHVQTVSALVETNRSLTIRELAQDTGLAPSTVLHILKDRLKMRKTASKWITHDLTDMQKLQRYEASRTLLLRYECIITIDESCIRFYEPQLKHQSDEWRHYGSP
ncbi:hypothetical protein ANN_06287 [Periplaneta americana]|uniref:HTH iclR-type domain-containing protein n=1 Tax=Periplaneta americana TaxID=6978 RepID=A0ABQ8TFL9_PERAM|nr:hypothetical protein ANN_06287 [Periplaneta americana]